MVFLVLERTIAPEKLLEVDLFLTYKRNRSCTLIEAKVDAGLFLLRGLALALKLACCLACLLRLLDGRVNDRCRINGIHNRLSFVFASLVIWHSLAARQNLLSVFTVFLSLVTSRGDWLSSVFSRV